VSDDLERLEEELARVEDDYFAARSNGGVPAELEARRRALIERIVQLERKVKPEVRADLEADEQARRRNGLDWHGRKRDEVLRREWEQWRYRRSKLPSEQRPPMMKMGQRECRYCGGYFEPTTLRQRHCTPTCRKLAHKGRA
jgi:hypothetical protein